MPRSAELIPELLSEGASCEFVFVFILSSNTIKQVNRGQETLFSPLGCAHDNVVYVSKPMSRYNVY